MFTAANFGVGVLAILGFLWVIGLIFDIYHTVKVDHEETGVILPLTLLAVIGTGLVWLVFYIGSLINNRG
jgi:hypothetical protein